ncbi:hypothetical protein CDD83_5473 [Cordyceps sp. RAO-2017]|nr:hypothetical protein CDD83_5473 [Cordyceps sp. RAO-2017]
MLSGIVASLAVAAAAYGLYAFLLHPALLSPLARIPSAHWSCAVSGLWILAARRRGRENRSLGDAHRRLGRVVRVAPNALSVDGVDAVRAVYQAGFDKWPWYSVFDNYGLPCLFSTLGAGPHARRKRALSHVYSKSYVQASAAAAAQARAVLLGRLLPLLRREAAAADPGGTEVQAVLMATTMDLVSAYVFGLAGGTAFLLDEPYRRRWLRLYLCRHRNHFWSQELPGLAALCARLGLRLEPPAVDAANEELRAWNKRLCDRAAAAPPPAAPPAAPR